MNTWHSNGVCHFCVPRGRFELPTRGFSVHCSTPELPRLLKKIMAHFCAKHFSLDRDIDCGSATRWRHCLYARDCQVKSLSEIYEAFIPLNGISWTREDLNPLPPPCKGGALPDELLAHNYNMGAWISVIFCGKSIPGNASQCQDSILKRSGYSRILERL